MKKMLKTTRGPQTMLNRYRVDACCGRQSNAQGVDPEALYDHWKTDMQFSH
ncbi:MAG: hypothetical protein ACPL4I_07340 [Bacteroidota bacterium]